MRPASLVWFAGVSWDGIRGTDRHLVSHLAKHVDVLWVDPPVSVVRLVRRREVRSAVARARLCEVEPGIHRLTPVVTPFPSRSGFSYLAATIAKRVTSNAVRHWARDVAAVVVTSPHSRLDVLPRARRVYYATDDFAAGAHLMGLAPDRLRKPERQRVKEADLLGAVSPEIMATWETGGRPLFVLPNGCDPEHYADVDEAALPADVDLPGPIAGMVGQLSPRVDLALLEAVADSGASLLLVGPLDPEFEPGRVRGLLARTNVQWVGQKSFAELPSYLRIIDVGLTPYADDAFNRASFPLKTLEYLSAGRAVVSTPLPAVERLGTPWIRTASGSTEFALRTSKALAEPRTDEAAAARRAFACQHSWSARAVTFLDLLGLREACSLPGETP